MPVHSGGTEIFMNYKKIKTSTVCFENPPLILNSAAVAGTKEGKGPLKNCYDMIADDDLCGEKTWEKAESRLQKYALSAVLKKANMSEKQIDYIFAGDLLNQCCGTHYAQKESNISFFGLYGACSTMAESLSLASMSIDGGFADYAIASTSSHFCSAEKQFRFPLEYGGQRTPTAQWTVTGSGAVLLGKHEKPPYITHVTTGKIVDMGIKDANNMGAAMAPAAADAIKTHFEDTGFRPGDYDLIATGDLGYVGSELLNMLMKENGFNIENVHNDCGCMIFYEKEQDVHSGGSGCGCSAVTLCAKILKEIRSGKLSKVLFIATGALLSQASPLQGETIPCIAHCVRITSGEVC